MYCYSGTVLVLPVDVVRVGYVKSVLTGLFAGVVAFRPAAETQIKVE